MATANLTPTTKSVVETFDTLTLTMEQTLWASALFRAIRREAERENNHLIVTLADQGLYWTDSTHNDLDCERERIAPKLCQGGV